MTCENDVKFTSCTISLAQSHACVFSTAYGFHATAVEFNSCDTGHLACKAENI